MISKTLLLCAAFINAHKTPSGCHPDHPSLSVAKDRILKASEWASFSKKNPLFVIGVSDSQCSDCCESEGLLLELDALSKNGTLTWTSETKSKKKKKNKTKVHKIPIVRIDTNDKDETAAFRDIGFMFKQVPKVFIVKNGMSRSTDHYAHFDVATTLHQIQAMVEPVI